MGGGEKKKTNQMANDLYNTAGARGTSTDNQWNSEYNDARQKANDMYNVQYQGYKGFADGTQGLDPALRDALLHGGTPGSGGGGGGGGNYGQVSGLYNNFVNTGGINAGAIEAAMAASKELSQTGGWDPNRIASQDQIISGLKDMGRTGGLDAEAIARMRGGGVFDEFAKSGGYSPEQIANMRARATSTIPAMYASMQRDVQNAAATSGMPTNPAMIARLGREQAREAAAASLNAETSIGDQVRQGREWGAGQMSSAENSLQALKTSNQLQGLKSSADVEQALINAIASNRLQGSGQWTQGELGEQNLIQQGKEFGTQGLHSIASQQAAAGAARAAQNDANLRFLAQMESGNQQFGLSGMTDLYKATPGEVNMYQDDILNNRQQQYGTQANMIDQRYANNKGFNWGGLIGTAAGIGANLLAPGVGAAGKVLSNGAGVGSKIWNAASTAYPGMRS